MGDYLTHLISRSLGQREVLSPRPTGLFELSSSANSLIPAYYPNSETMAQEQVTPDWPSTVLPLSKPTGKSRRSVSGVQGHLEAPSYQMDDLQPYPHQSLGQPTNLQQPRSKILAPQSPEISTERGPSQSDSNPAGSKVAPITPCLTEKSYEQRLTQPDTKTTEPGPSPIVIHKVPQESGMNEYISPPLVTRGTADAMPMSPQSPATQQNQFKIASTRRPGMGGRIDTPSASLSSIIGFSEPQAIHSNTIEPALTRIDVRPYTELINGASLEPVINVTIGRIEVKATKPREPEQPRQKKKPSSVMSLDKYLSQSERGGRG